MKKLLLTAVISGLMTTGASAVPLNRIDGANCPSPKEVTEARKKKPEERRIKYQDNMGDWTLSSSEEDLKVEAKTLTQIQAIVSPSLEISCNYNDGQILATRKGTIKLEKSPY